MKLLVATIAAFVTVLTTIGVTIAIAAQGPGRGPAQTQSPRPLVGETMPIGGDIARTIHFYHDLLGLQCRSGGCTSADPSNNVPAATLGRTPSPIDRHVRGWQLVRFERTVAVPSIA